MKKTCVQCSKEFNVVLTVADIDFCGYNCEQEYYGLKEFVDVSEIGSLDRGELNFYFL